MNTPLHYLAAIALTLASAASFAHDYTAGPIKVGQPWSRATPAGAKIGGGYLSIENTGAAPDRLVSVAVPFAGRVEMHEMAVKDGVMTMRPLEQGVSIAPGRTVEFKPGGFHLMFMDLKQPLKQGEGVKGTLTFEKAGAVEVEFKVESIGARAASTDAAKPGETKPGEHKH